MVKLTIHRLPYIHKKLIFLKTLPEYMRWTLQCGCCYLQGSMLVLLLWWMVTLRFFLRKAYKSLLMFS